MAAAAVHLAAPLGSDDECRQGDEGSAEPSCVLHALQRRATSQALGAASATGASEEAIGTSARAAVAPPGVNLGGWLVLEDWFFSGSHGHHVASQGSAGQGVGLPPLLKGLEEKPWQSEGLLTKWLQDTRGDEEALKVFSAHRETFITDSDFEQIAGLGIRSVRVPLPWAAFADALSPIDPEVYRPGAKIVPDPVYGDAASFVTVDRKWLAGLLQQAARHSLKIVLDLHFMPAGSSDGTYNGIWPLKPKFWTDSVSTSKGDVPLTQVGLWIAEAMVKWVESLGPAELGVVEGITLLNEPGHMASIDKNLSKPFTRGEEQVLDWMGEAAGLFRRSTLPGKGVKLYVSASEPSFDNFWETVAPWYMKAFTAQERHAWAVFDIHWYTAWGACSGRTVPGGGYLCSEPAEKVRPLLHQCIEKDMAKFERKVDGLKSCSEFSLGTFEDPTMACSDKGLLSMFLEEQLASFKQSGIQGFFWTWRMPYGSNFEDGWSFKHFAGLE